MALPIVYSAYSSNSAEGSEPGETTNRAGVLVSISSLLMIPNEKGLPLTEEICN